MTEKQKLENWINSERKNGLISVSASSPVGVPDEEIFREMNEIIAAVEVTDNDLF